MIRIIAWLSTTTEMITPVEIAPTNTFLAIDQSNIKIVIVFNGHPAACTPGVLKGRSAVILAVVADCRRLAFITDGVTKRTRTSTAVVATFHFQGILTRRTRLPYLSS
jgi:hypothetical protein